jgi:exosortase
MTGAIVARRPLRAHAPILLAFAATYWFVVAGLVRQWADDPNYAHGFFVVPMAAWLVWRRRAALRATPGRVDPRGLIVIAAGGVLYLGGLLAGELFTQRASLVVMVGGAVLWLEGRARARILALPLCFLLAMVPLPYVFYYRLTFPLQVESSRLAAAVLGAGGMPLVREGNVLHLESYSLEVVTACSGLRSIMTLGTLAVFMTDFLRVSTGWKAIFLALVVPVAIVANVARLVGTASLAALAGPAAAESFLHELSGLLVFVVGVLALAAGARGVTWIARARA